MNNAFASIPEASLTEEITDRLRTEESRIIRILESLEMIQSTKEWDTLKKELFDDLVNYIERQLLSEAKSETVDLQKLNRLVGELKWAKRFSNLDELSQVYKEQLKNIKSKLYA